MNSFDDVRKAVADAETTLRAADSIADDMARLLVGRLHHVKSPWVLAYLKRELRDFNLTTKKWKS